MLNTQKNYIDYLNVVENELKKTQFSDEIINGFNLREIKNTIKDCELLVPVIGAFSAGKSTLINSFLESSILPTDPTPETALATELRYSNKNYIEAIKEDGSADVYELDQSDALKEKSHAYKFLKIYLNNQRLKEIEPLILVDMPGFDSPLELHNQAILSYLNKGIYFIVLTSVEDGGIVKSVVRELRNITEFGKGFSFCVSKTNLRPEEDVHDVKSKIEDQLNDEFDLTSEVILISDNAGENLKKTLKSINAEKLFQQVFNEDLKSNYFQIESAINTTIATHKNSKDEASEALRELLKGVEKIKNKKSNMQKEAKERYSNHSSERIITTVANELVAHQDSLIPLAIRDKDAFSLELNDIVKNKLIFEIRKSIQTISDDIVDDFSLEVKHIGDNLEYFAIGDEWIEKVSDTTKHLLNSALTGIGKLQDITKDKNGKLYKVITSVLGLTTAVLNPILEVLIVFMPEIITFFTGKSKENRETNEMKRQFHSEIIPSLKIKLRSVLPSIFNEQVNHLIEQISIQFDENLKHKEQEIAAVIEEKENKLTNNEEIISKYKTSRKKIQCFANKALFEEH